MANTRLYSKWTSYKSENLDAVFSAMGFSWLAKKLGSSINVNVSIEPCSDTTTDDEEILLSVKSVFVNTETRLRIGGTISWDGGTSTAMDCLTVWEEGKLVIFMGDCGTDPRISGRRQTREMVSNDEMLLTIDWNGTVARRWFRRTGNTEV